MKKTLLTGVAAIIFGLAAGNIVTAIKLHQTNKKVSKNFEISKNNYLLIEGLLESDSIQFLHLEANSNSIEGIIQIIKKE